MVVLAGDPDIAPIPNLITTWIHIDVLPSDQPLMLLTAWVPNPPAHS
jgi:hypothetical protein